MGRHVILGTPKGNKRSKTYLDGTVKILLKRNRHPLAWDGYRLVHVLSACDDSNDRPLDRTHGQSPIADATQTFL